MKVTQKQKNKTRRQILKAARDVICEKGFKQATMREIARLAQVGDATIYNYFPSKERILYAYCEEKQKEVAISLKSIPDFHEYTLGEQLQQLVEVELEVWRPDRDFFDQVYHRIIYSPTASVSMLKENRKLFSLMVQDLIEAAIEAGEIPEQPYVELVPYLLWDYVGAIFAYWLKDDSEDFANTTRVVDGSMEIISVILSTGLIGKGLDLLSFLFRTYLSRNLESFQHVPSSLNKTKRQFMDGLDEKFT